MMPHFNDIQVRAFLPSEATLLRMRKRELLDWLYVACKNWDTECSTVERVTARLRQVNAITETKGETK